MARQDIDTTPFLVHIAAISALIQQQLKEADTNSFEHKYLSQAAEYYLSAAESPKITLAALGVGTSQLYSISSNCLPFLFLPEQTADGIKLKFSHLSHQLLIQMKSKILHFKIHEGQRKENEIIRNRLKKIDEKLKLADKYLNAQQTHESLILAIKSKTIIIQQFQQDLDKSNAHELITGITDYINDIQAGISTPYREPVKSEDAAAFKNKHKKFFNGPVTNFLGKETHINVAHEMAASDSYTQLSLMPELNELAYETFKAIKTSELTADEKENLLNKLNQACSKKRLATYEATFEPPLPQLHNDIKVDSMETYIKRFVHDFIRLRLLLATVDLSDLKEGTKNLFDTFFSNTLLHLAQHIATLTTAVDKKHQHRIISDATESISKELRELTATTRQFVLDGSELDNQFTGLITKMIKNCDLSEIPADEYKKPVKSKVKSFFSHAASGKIIVDINLGTTQVSRTTWEMIKYLMRILSHVTVEQTHRNISVLLEQADELADIFISLFKLVVTPQQLLNQSPADAITQASSAICETLTSLRAMIPEEEPDHIMLASAEITFKSKKAFTLTDRADTIEPITTINLAY